MEEREGRGRRYNILSWYGIWILIVKLVLFVLPNCTPLEIFVPSPGIELMLSAVKALSPNHWIARKSPKWLFFKSNFHHDFLINPKNMISRGNLWLFLWFTWSTLNSLKFFIIKMPVISNIFLSKQYTNKLYFSHFLWIRIKSLGRDENIWLNENWQRTKIIKNN